MVTVVPVSAFKDNYIWLLINPHNQYCAVVDPGDANPVLDALAASGLTLSAILITHHHFDHTGGMEELRKKLSVPIYGPAHDGLVSLDHGLVEDDEVELEQLGLTFKVLDIPGHTKGHIAYFGAGMLFCGDTLFSAGCGRLFEGTAQQMANSLSKIAHLPDNTDIYCAHEYTAANLRFAEVIEPNNKAIQTRIHEVALLRDKNCPTLPSTLSIEKATNPFLRCDQDSVIESARQKCQTQLTDPVSIFQALRAWKDTF